MSVSLARLMKVQLMNRPDPDEEDVFDCIMRVDKPGYIPEGVTVRTAINDQMFTATLQAKMLPRLDEDPDVVSMILGSCLENL